MFQIVLFKVSDIIKEFHLFIWGKVFPEYRAELRKGYIVVLPLTYGISKIGCFLAGCCYGLPYNGPFYVKYHGDMVYVSEMTLFPVQLAETVVFILIFLVGYYWAYVKDLENATILILCVCALAKFLLDYLRASHTNQILSMNQIACIIVAALTRFLQCHFRSRFSFIRASPYPKCQGFSFLI